MIWHVYGLRIGAIQGLHRGICLSRKPGADAKALEYGHAPDLLEKPNPEGSHVPNNQILEF